MSTLHCNPSGPAECGVLSKARALSTGAKGCMDCELPHLAGVDQRILYDRIAME